MLDCGFEDFSWMDEVSVYCANGDIINADKFISVWREYSKARDVTKRRLYLEMMQEVFPKLDKKVIIDQDLKSFLPFMQVDGKGVSK